MAKPYWTLPDDADLDAFLALTVAQRGAALLAMTPSRRIAFAVAYAKRDGSQPYRICDRFAAWEQQHLNTLEVL